MASTRLRVFALRLVLALASVAGARAATVAEAYWQIIRGGNLQLSNSVGGIVEGNGADPGVSRWRSLGNLESGYRLMQDRLKTGPVGIDFVEELHGRVTAGHASADPGKMRFRTGATVLASGTFQGPDAAYAPADVLRQRSTEFDQMLKKATSGGLSRAETIKAAATAHAEISRLHYFANGNGRMARLTADFIFMKNGFPPVSHIPGSYLINVSNKAWADVSRGHDRVIQHYEKYYGEALQRSEQRLPSLLARQPGGWMRGPRRAGRAGGILAAAGVVGLLGYDALQAMGVVPSLPGERTGRGMLLDIARTAVPVLVSTAAIAGGIFAYDHFRSQLPRLARIYPVGLIAAVVAGVSVGALASRLMGNGRDQAPARPGEDAVRGPSERPAVAAATGPGETGPLDGEDLRIRD